MDTEQKLLELLNDPRTGLRDSSDTNKTRYAALAILEDEQKATARRIVEIAEGTKRTIHGEESSQAWKFGKEEYNQALSDLITKINQDFLS
jgi:hypothetical protein